MHLFENAVMQTELKSKIFFYFLPSLFLWTVRLDIWVTFKNCSDTRGSDKQASELCRLAGSSKNIYLSRKFAIADCGKLLSVWYCGAVVAQVANWKVKNCTWHVWSHSNVIVNEDVVVWWLYVILCQSVRFRGRAGHRGAFQRESFERDVFERVKNDRHSSVQNSKK